MKKQVAGFVLMLFICVCPAWSAQDANSLRDAILGGKPDLNVRV